MEKSLKGTQAEKERDLQMGAPNATEQRDGASISISKLEYELHGP
jgi:hypothetical protein